MNVIGKTQREVTPTISSPMCGREWTAVALASAVWIAVLWVVTDAGGAVGVARADDWSYILTQFALADTGRLALNNWAVTFLFGQTVTAVPVVAIFGPVIAPLQAMIAIFGVAALVFTYVLVRRYLAPGLTAVAVATLAFSPIFGPSAISFMTDIPALFFLSLSLFVGARALDAARLSTPMLVVTCLLGLVAFTFRDYAILGCLVILLVAIVRGGSSRAESIRSIVSFTAVVVVATVLYQWRHSLPNDLSLDGWPLDYSLTLTARASLTLALLICPVLLLLRPRTIWAWLPRYRVWMLTGAVVVVVIVTALARGELLGNVIHPFGNTWLVVGSGVRMWPLWVNRLIVAVAIMALLACLITLAAFLVEIRRRWRHLSLRAVLTSQAQTHGGRTALVLFPLAIVGAHTLATLILGTWWLDRYFILVVPFLAAGILIVGSRLGALGGSRSRWVAGIGLGGLAVMGLHVTDFDARFDGARWELGTVLVNRGYAPETVDAGMQWVSFHATEVGLGAQQVPTREGRPWWTERYPNQIVCVTVRAREGAEAAPDREIAAMEVRTLFGRLYTLYAAPGPDTCPN